MYLVMTIKKDLPFGNFGISLCTDKLAGMAPVFKKKRDAVAYAKKLNAQVLKIALVEP